jgi:dTMP kinase
MAECLGADVPEPPLLLTREPGGTALGGKIRQLLMAGNPSTIQARAELLLFAADRAQHVEEFLKPHLAKGTIILCDRYTDSTIAYQGYGRQLDLHLIEQLNQIATGGLASDLTFWLDVETPVGLARAQQRGKFDRIEQADLAFHHRVRQGFAELAAAYPQRIARIDASQDEEAVHLAIQELLCQRFSQWFQTPSQPL